jgi:hypothetical protein
MLRENAPPAVILTVEATDRDQGVYGQVPYYYLLLHLNVLYSFSFLLKKNQKQIFLFSFLILNFFPPSVGGIILPPPVLLVGDLCFLSLSFFSPFVILHCYMAQHISLSLCAS